MKPQKAIHHHPYPSVINGKWKTLIDHRKVVVLSVTGNYAMVRRPRAMPYVAPIKELELQ